MCVFSRPSPPPLPEPRPTAPRPEATADRVAVGRRSFPGMQTSSSFQKRTGRQSIRTPRRLGTSSLRIPLLNQEQTGSGNLRY